MRYLCCFIVQCCDHPYIVDSSLQPSLIAGLSPDQGVEVGVKASGKLRLLNDILSRIRDQRLKALVLFQVYWLLIMKFSVDNVLFKNCAYI